MSTIFSLSFLFMIIRPMNPFIVPPFHWLSLDSSPLKDSDEPSTHHQRPCDVDGGLGRGDARVRRRSLSKPPGACARFRRGPTHALSTDKCVSHPSITGPSIQSNPIHPADRWPLITQTHAHTITANKTMREKNDGRLTNLTWLIYWLF